MAHELSVVMPVYNGARYLSAALDSVLRQSFPNFEVLIMDDGSTDETPAILAGYAARDPRIRVFRRPRQGQIATRNELLRLAQSDMVACADADDICLPDRFERQLRAMSRDGRLWILGTAMISINGSGRHRKRWRVPTGSDAVAAELERRCCIGHPSCMMRRQNILAIGGYRPGYEAAEDYDLFLRASERGKVDNLEAVGVLYRKHRESVTQRQALRQAISVDLARATHNLRVAGRPDPTVDLLDGPPDLEDLVVTALLSPEQMEYHRAMAVTADLGAESEDVDRALQYFLSAPVDKKQSIATQRAIVRLLARRSFDRASLAAVLRAISLGPGRLVRLWAAGHPA
jgi:GT2 family glycosyltransferase